MKDESGIVLGIELSSRQGSLALLKDGAVLAEKTWIGENVRHNVLFQTLETLLQETHLSYSDISLYAVGRGPGSFSGMRMSFAVAQALALPNQAAGVRGRESAVFVKGYAEPQEDSDSKSAVGNQKSEIQINPQSPISHPQSEVRAVSSGAALALAAAREGVKEIAVVGDARRGQFWIGFFKVGQASSLSACAQSRSSADRLEACPTLIEDWKLIPYEELVVPEGTLVVSPEAERLTQYFPNLGAARFPLASDVAALAVQQAESEPLEPLYMHPPVFIEPKYS